MQLGFSVDISSFRTDALTSRKRFLQTLIAMAELEQGERYKAKEETFASLVRHIHIYLF